MEVFCSYVTDFEKQNKFGIDLIANAFRGSIQNKRLFSIFSSFLFHHLSFRKMEGGLFLLTHKG